MYNISNLIDMIEKIQENRKDTVNTCVESALKYTQGSLNASYYASITGALEASVGFLLDDINRIYNVVKSIEEHE